MYTHIRIIYIYMYRVIDIYWGTWQRSASRVVEPPRGNYDMICVCVRVCSCVRERGREKERERE